MCEPRLAKLKYPFAFEQIRKKRQSQKKKKLFNNRSLDTKYLHKFTELTKKTKTHIFLGHRYEHPYFTAFAKSK